MFRYFKFAATAIAALTLCGCPPTESPLRRYAFVNTTDSTITDFTISIGSTSQKSVVQTWDQTPPGQGWVYSTRHPAYLILSWQDETGDYERTIFSERRTIFRSTNDLYVELHPNGGLASRPIEPPSNNGNVWALIPAYFFYCLVLCLFIGVPLAMAAVVAYVLFKFMRAVLIATLQGLHGDRSVFQFTIREIALLTTMVALACGWLLTICR